MNKNTVRIIFSFSIVILIISVFLFYVTLPSDDTFIVVIISMAFGLLTSVLSLLSYRKRAIEEGSDANVTLTFIVYLSIFFIAILIRTIVLIVNFC